PEVYFGGSSPIAGEVAAKYVDAYPATGCRRSPGSRVPRRLTDGARVREAFRTLYRDRTQGADDRGAEAGRNGAIGDGRHAEGT
ncbi:hypothetical protein, partial [Streptomyces sp. NPDC005486]|uniref:hypothetical protein n=1 Tax=Streptomyces sp. NPDC005486 TaxID=3155345 RepID=UPI0033A4E104